MVFFSYTQFLAIAIVATQMTLMCVDAVPMPREENRINEQFQKFGDNVKNGASKISKELASPVAGSIVGTGTGMATSAGLAAVGAGVALGAAAPIVLPIAAGVAGTIAAVGAKKAIDEAIKKHDADEAAEKRKPHRLQSI